VEGPGAVQEVVAQQPVPAMVAEEPGYAPVAPPQPREDSPVESPQPREESPAPPSFTPPAAPPAAGPPPSAPPPSF
jgi:hypothetical protein